MTSQARAAAGRLVEFASELCGNWPTPGGTLALVGRDGVLATAVWGKADRAAGTAMRLDHKFEIGSISKTFTSLLIHSLAADGLVDLDAPAAAYAPWIEVGEPAPSLRQLLSHTAGLIMGADHLPDERAQVWSLRDRARGPIGQFHYSNVGYMILGQVAEAVTGQSVADALHHRVLSRMGMPDARTGVVHADRAVMATGHWALHDDQPWLPGDVIAPATWFEVACADGNIASDVVELSQLVRLLLGDGTLDGVEVISTDALHGITSPEAPTGEPELGWPGLVPMSSSRYGLGVNVEDIAGHHVVSHGGGMVGFSTFMLADISAGVGAVVLTNGNGEYPAAQVIARAAHSLLVDGVDGELPPAHLTVHASELAESHFGTFTSDGITVRVHHEGDLVAVNDGWLLRTFNERFGVDDPQLRGYHLYEHEDGWSWAGHRLRHDPVDHEPHPMAAALVGHYRSYTPWYPNFRIVSHSGRLFLVSPSGIEAHTDECELIEISTGCFRIGADPGIPERLVVGPLVDGVAISVDRDGAVYSRSFTP